MSRRRPAEIAIIGLGCRFAGAPDASTFFENILAGKDSTREVPADRWSPETFCDPLSPACDRVPTCRGGYLDSPLEFDAAEHGIMPRTVAGGEPEQFLVLQAATAALADAGLEPARLSSLRVDVVIGRGNYFNRGNLTRLQHGRLIAQTVALLHAIHPEWSPQERQKIADDLRASLPPFEAATIPGQLTNATAGRLAHRFNLSGASFVVDAASASSLVAVDLAMRALRSRRANLAIAAGVYLEADVDFPLVFRQLGALSRSGTARPFGSLADGMLPGEGAGVVILKRLSDAERDGDRIYAVIQAVGISSDGRSQGLAAPSASGHARAMRRAYRLARIDPATVALIEGHGLGVPAADRAELRALRSVFPPLAHGHRVLGAVSSMIGHAMPAAGIAGLIKTALALFHRVLPPTLHAEQPHPLLDRPDSPFKLNPASRPWIHAEPQSPRRAGVNAFGFAGINAHAVLEEHIPSADGPFPGALQTWDSEAILISAPTRAGLSARMRELSNWLSRPRRESLKDVAYTLNCVENHSHDSARLGIVASSLAELADRIAATLPRLDDPACRTIRDARGVYFWQEPSYSAQGRSLAFLFPGEGSQYPGMMADLCIYFPVVRRLFDTADRIARDVGDAVPPSHCLFARAAAGDEKLWSPATAVNVVLNAQWAMYQLLTALEITPDAVVGHSSGELLALSAAGVFPTDRSLEQKLGRLGAIFRAFESSGDLPAAHLVAIAADRDRVAAICRGLEATGTALAMDNCPHQVVLAVPPSEFDRLVERLRSECILWEDLPFSRAYHTPSFKQVLAPIEQFFAGMPFVEPRVPIYSCASGRRMPSDATAIRDLAVRQWTTTVAFRETIETMHADGCRVFIDVGARGNLAGFVEDILRGKSAFAVAANLPRRSGLTQLNHLVASLFAQGVPLKPDCLYARRRPRPIDWRAPDPQPRATVDLAIGFPEMHFSDSLLAHLQSAPLTRPPRSSGDDGVLASQDAQGSGTVYLTEHFPRNGASGFERGQVQDPTMPSAAEPRLGVLEELVPRSVSHAAPFNRLTERFAGDDEAASTAENAMLWFQETMQAFLETQHEVMNAYLHPAADAHEVAASEVCEHPSAPSAAARSHAEAIASAEPGRPAPKHGPSAGPDRPVTSGPHPGPWCGEVRHLVPGHEIETLVVLDARTDPVAHHHTLGGRKVSALDPSLKGLPVLPFAVMAEMTAQAAALAVTPGLFLTGLAQVRAHKWVRYEDEPVFLELRGHRTPCSGDERFWVGIFNRGPLGKSEALRPVFEAIAIFDVATPEPPPQSDWSLPDARPSKFTARSVYDEQWLFHGPALQAISHVGNLARGGIDGTLRVLPLAPLTPENRPAHFHTDFIILDNFTHLLGAWGLDYLSEGDVVFPLSMDELEIFGDRPDEGAQVACRISVIEIEHHRLRVESEIIREDGTVWMRIRDWEDWRFHWPACYRDVMRQPQDFLVGEELLLSSRAGTPTPTAAVGAVWLEPPADMGRPVWRDVLEQIQLGPSERSAVLASIDSEQERTRELWGRMAAKEAARRLWLDAGSPPVYPADLVVSDDDHGALRLFALAQPGVSVPVAIAHTAGAGAAAAIAAADQYARVGIEIARIDDLPPGAQPAATSAGEEALLARFSPSTRAEWVARFRCARNAVERALGPAGSCGTPRTCEIVSVDEASGIIEIKLLQPVDRSVSLDRMPSVFAVSHRRGDHALAWTVVEGASL